MGSVFRKPKPRPTEEPQEEAAKQTAPEQKPQEAGGIPTGALPSRSRRRDRLLQSVVGGQLSGYAEEEGKLGYTRRQR